MVCKKDNTNYILKLKKLYKLYNKMLTTEIEITFKITR